MWIVNWAEGSIDFSLNACANTAVVWWSVWMWERKGICQRYFNTVNYCSWANSWRTGFPARCPSQKSRLWGISKSVKFSSLINVNVVERLQADTHRWPWSISMSADSRCGYMPLFRFGVILSSLLIAVVKQWISIHQWTEKFDTNDTVKRKFVLCEQE